MKIYLMTRCQREIIHSITDSTVRVCLRVGVTHLTNDRNICDIAENHTAVALVYFTSSFTLLTPQRQVLSHTGYILRIVFIVNTGLTGGAQGTQTRSLSTGETHSQL